MKTLTLTLNIGTRDAKRLGLKKTAEGESVSVDKDVADEMLKRGWAVEGKAATGDADDFEEMTKEELKAYADAHNIPHVTMAMAKDDMVRAVKRAAK